MYSYKQINVSHALKACLVPTILILAPIVSQSLAQEPANIIISPQDEPSPALKYRLLPKVADRIPGNAAVYYGKVTAEQTYFFTNKELHEKFAAWREMPLDELRNTDSRVPFDPYYLRQAALCKSCDWQFPIGRGKFFEILLPEIQQTRNFSRILNTISRIQIAKGEYESAVATFQTTLALGRNVAEGETVVNGLVGVAIHRHVYSQILEFIQQPDSPNLYWALTNLPSPLIDMRKAIEVELEAFKLSYPKYKDWEKTKLAEEQWPELLYGLCEYLAVLLEGENEERDANELYRVMLRAADAAKLSLTQQHGLPAEEVDAMSKEQAVAVYSLNVIRNRQQEIAKYFSLPYPEASLGMLTAIADTSEPLSPDFPSLELLFSSYSLAREAIAINERSLAVLRIVEALRIYGARNNGKLPNRLSDVIDMPIPLNPVSREPFEYELNDGVATLSGLTLGNLPNSYEIEMHTP